MALSLQESKIIDPSVGEGTSPLALSNLDDLKNLDDKRLGVELFHGVSNLLQYTNKSRNLPIHVTIDHYKIVMSLSTELKEVYVRAMKSFLRRLDEPEIQRRVRVMTYQLHQLASLVAWPREQKRSPSLTQEMDDIFRIANPWSTFSNVNVRQYMDVCRHLNPQSQDTLILESSKRYLGEKETMRRWDLMKFMSNRIHLTKWWPEEDLESAKKQGLNIMAIVTIGDELHLGDSKLYRRHIWGRDRARLAFQRLEDQFVRSSPVSSTSCDLIWEMHDWNTFDWKEFDWANSAEHSWFLKNPKRAQIYRDGLKDLVNQLDTYGIYETKDTRVPRRARRWWTSGDILLWHENGLHPAEVIAVGDALGLKSYKDITVKTIKILDEIYSEIGWTSAFGEKIELLMMYFECRYHWNLDPPEHGNVQDVLQYILERHLPRWFHFRDTTS